MLWPALMYLPGNRIQILFLVGPGSACLLPPVENILPRKYWAKHTDPFRTTQKRIHFLKNILANVNVSYSTVITWEFPGHIAREVCCCWIHLDKNQESDILGNSRQCRKKLLCVEGTYSINAYILLNAVSDFVLVWHISGLSANAMDSEYIKAISSFEMITSEEATDIF